MPDKPSFGIGHDPLRPRDETDRPHVGEADRPHVGEADRPHVGKPDRPLVSEPDELHVEEPDRLHVGTIDKLHPIPLEPQKACEHARDWLLEKLFSKHELSTYVGMVLGAVHGSTEAIVPCGVKDLRRSDAPDASTLYMIASMSKSFTALQLAMHVAKGDVTLETKLQELLDRFYPGTYALPPQRQRISLLDLATHYSGFPKWPRKKGSDGNWKRISEDVDPELFKAARDMAPVYSTNQYFYSNMGYLLLGHLLSRFGKSKALKEGDWGKDVDEAILRPLGMTSTGTTATLGDSSDWSKRAATGYASADAPADDPPFATADYGDIWADGKYNGWSKSGFEDPSGGMWSTAGDVMRWMKFHLGTLPDVPASLDALRAELHRVRLPAQSDSGAPDGSVGLGFKMEPLDDGADSPTIVWKGGDLDEGYHSYMGFIPELGVGAFVLCNWPISHGDKLGLGKRMMAAMLGR